MPLTPPTEVAEVLYSLLQKATQHDAERSSEVTNGMLEYGFGHVQLLTQMQEAQRIACYWRLMELGALPLVVQALQPGQPFASFAMTLTGLLFKDENLLAHKMGVVVLKQEKFLPAIMSGLQSTADPQLPFLNAQVLHNILRSTSGRQIQALAEQKALLAQLGKLCRQWFASDEKGDWRYLFILVDCLLLFEIGNAGQELDSAGVSQLPIDILMMEDNQVLKEHEALANRIIAWIFLYTMRKRHSKDEPAVQHRQMIFDHLDRIKSLVPTAELERDPKTLDHAQTTAGSTVNLYRSLEALKAGDETHGLPIHLTVKSRVRNWEQVEKEAEGKVRSPDFKKQFDAQMKAKLASEKKEPKPVLDVSDDESDEEAGDSRKRRDQQAPTAASAAAPAAAAPATQPATTTSTTGAAAETAGTAEPAPKEVLDQVLRLKNEGNTYFRGEEYSDAAEIYTEALQLLQSGGYSSEETTRLLGNRSECYLKLNKYNEAAADATAALASDPKFVKAYYRRAKASQHLGQIKQAIDDVKEMLRLDEGNKAGLALLEELKKAGGSV